MGVRHTYLVVFFGPSKLASKYSRYTPMVTGFLDRRGGDRAKVTYKINPPLSMNFVIAESLSVQRAKLVMSGTWVCECVTVQDTLEVGREPGVLVLAATLPNTCAWE